MIIYPFLGALALGSGTILQKLILRKKSIDVKLYIVLEFLFISLLMIPLIYFLWNVQLGAFTLTNILLLLLVVILSIIANLFVVYSMKWEKVSKLEPAKVLEPLFVVIFALIFSFFSMELFERNFNVIIPAFIASIALVFSHVKKHHLKFNKYFIAAIFGSLFFALELVISRFLLVYYSSFSFYFVRTFLVFLICLIIFRPDFSPMDKKSGLKFFFLGAIWIIFRVSMYYGYVHLGVVSTTLIIMLGPVFIYLFAWKFLKEKIELRNIIAAFVIVGCVLYSLLI